LALGDKTENTIALRKINGRFSHRPSLGEWGIIPLDRTHMAPHGTLAETGPAIMTDSRRTQAWSNAGKVRNM
jgi:hypothetical protein